MSILNMVMLLCFCLKVFDVFCLHSCLPQYLSTSPGPVVARSLRWHLQPHTSQPLHPPPPAPSTSSRRPQHQTPTRIHSHSLQPASLNIHLQLLPVSSPSMTGISLRQKKKLTESINTLHMWLYFFYLQYVVIFAVYNLAFLSVQHPASAITSQLDPLHPTAASDSQPVRPHHTLRSFASQQQLNPLHAGPVIQVQPQPPPAAATLSSAFAYSLWPLPAPQPMPSVFSFHLQPLYVSSSLSLCLQGKSSLFAPFNNMALRQDIKETKGNAKIHIILCLTF